MSQDDQKLDEVLRQLETLISWADENAAVSPIAKTKLHYTARARRLRQAYDMLKPLGVA